MKEENYGSIEMRKPDVRFEAQIKGRKEAKGNDFAEEWKACAH